MKIVFFGTPQLAADVLGDFLELGAAKDIEVVGVVCQPDKPVGRKQVLTACPVKLLAQQYNLPVLQPQKVRNNVEFFKELKQLDADYFIVIAYGKIVPKEILDIPKEDCLNLHGSILPKYRGAAPIQFALMNGDKETGVTLMQMNEKMDEGDMIAVHTISIDSDEMAGSLFEKFSAQTGKFAVEALVQYNQGQLVAIPQDHSQATYTKILAREDGKIDWSNPVQKIYNLWQGLTPWPAVHTFYKSKKLTIELCTIAPEVLSGAVGEVIKIAKNRYGVVCGDGRILELKQVKMEGKKSQDIMSFINGYRNFETSILSID